MIILCLAILLPSKLFGQAPVINLFSPVSGAVGSTVTITGTGFAAAKANNIVFFGATQATVITASSTILTVKVPTGATYAAITILNTATGLAAYSPKFFLPVSSPVKADITAADFKTSINLQTGQRPSCVVIGDIDGDGKPDLLIANNTGNTISVFRNTGTPTHITFASRVDIPLTAAGWIAIGDVDGDGKLDLAVLNGNIVSVFRNTSTTGHISFAAKVDNATGTGPSCVAIGDIDGDGKPDMVTANYGDSTLSVFHNTGTRGAINFAPKQTFAPGPRPQYVAIGDLDGDGKPDLSIANNVPNATISIFRNTSTPGTINFANLISYPTLNYPAGYDPSCISVGDLDGDGKPDLLIADSYLNCYSTFRNASTPGHINMSMQSPINYTGGEHYLSTTADLNGDGKPDIAAANYDDFTVSIIKNTSTTGNIQFSGSGFTFPCNGRGPLAVAVGDIDGDGRPDIVQTNLLDNTIAIYRNNPIFPPKLAGLSISNGTLLPAFNADSINYNATVKGGTRSVTITPTLLDIYASVKVNGVAVTSGTASQSIDLKPGDNAIPVVVTAQDGKTQTYTVLVSRTPSPSGTLSSLTLSSGTLLPVFDRNKTTYVDTVANDVSVLQITPTATSADAVIKVNGNLVASGTAASVPLIKVGIPNEIHIVVRSHDGIDVTYNLLVTRLSSNAKLASLSIVGIQAGSTTPLWPAFSPERNFYRDTINAYKNTIEPVVQITLTLENSHATVTLDGRPVTSGVATGLTSGEVKVGVDTLKIGVTAQDGNTREYRIVLVRPFLSRDATLSDLTISSGTLSPAFASNIYAYSDTVANNVATVQVTPTANNKYATIGVKGQSLPSGATSADIGIKEGGNILITINVTANLGNSKHYKITVHRLSATGNSIVNNSSSFASLSNSLTVTAYPNPSSSTFNLKITNGNTNNKATIRVVNLQGKTVYETSGGVNDTFAFGQDLPGGIYIVIVTNGSFKKQLKLIKAMN